MDMMKKRKRWGDEEDLLLLHLLPLHLLHQVLVWLPVVSLLRFKTVCKSWCDLIQSPFFIDLHTPITLNASSSSSSSSSSEFGSFIVHVNRYFPPPNSSSKDTLFMLSSISGDDDQEGLVVVDDDLGFDMDSKEIVGSCNGLVCLRDTNRELRDTNRGLEVSLWNPATEKFSVLPESIPIPGGMHNLFVFGFDDVETKDYKVVRFTSLRPRWNGYGSPFCFCRVQVYSLSSNSWRLLEGITRLPGHPFGYQQSVVYLNGTCFFLSHYFYTRRKPCLPVNDRFVISFDFTKEILTPIQLPHHDRDQELCLCSLGDKIALFTSTNPTLCDLDFGLRFRNCEEFNIWVLNYVRGSSSSSVVDMESWTKFHSFQLQRENPDRNKWYKPIGISNDGKFALLTSEYDTMLNLYNFATKEMKRNLLSCGMVRSKAHAYKLSLVSVIGGNVAGEMVQGGGAAAAAADMVIENSATNL